VSAADSNHPARSLSRAPTSAGFLNRSKPHLRPAGTPLGLSGTFSLCISSPFVRLYLLHVPRTRKLKADRNPVQGLSGEHPGASRVSAGPAGRGQVPHLRRAQALSTVRGLPRPAVPPPDSPEADAHARRENHMTPLFKGKPEFDFSVPCPSCSHKIRPNELLRLASHIQCPSCGAVFDEMAGKKPLSTS
jgi:hypothetical protein